MDDRTELLFGKENLDKLQNLRVAIIGIGGVGGYVFESLVRLGIKNILIVDNAENGLYPEMQLIFGETVVLMQKEFGIKVVLTTQSPFLLEAIEVFSEKYDVEDKTHYYLVEDGNIKNVDGETRQIYKEMVKPIQELENIKYE